MLLRNRFLFAFIGLVTFAATGCGSGGGNFFTGGNPPPSGGFAPSNLNGTYVFSISGTDANGAPLAIAGTFTANGSNGITSGTLDLNDPSFNQVTFPNLSVSGSSSYRVGQDGRGQATLVVNGNPFGTTLVFDFVLQDSAHGMISEFDANATGSGTLDLQSSGVTPAGTYAFSFAGASVDLQALSAAPWAIVGDFTVGNGGAIQGLEDYNLNGAASTSLTLSGNVVLGPSASPATTFNSSATSANSQTYDVFAISASHLKFIEMDQNGTLVGDAFSQTSTSLPAATYAFILEGAYPVSDIISAAGGFMVTDGNGNITNASTVDANNGGNGVTATTNFSGTYASAGSGRYTLNQLSNFEGTQYVAYAYNGGLLLLEIDDLGFMSGAAYPQTSNTFASGQGYAFNLTGANLAASFSGAVEVDDIAEFVANSSGNTITGVLDENFEPGGGISPGLQLQGGTYAVPDASGRGQIATNIGGNSTLNGGFALNFYAVDGTTFPFVQTDGNGQSAAGVFVQQNAKASASSNAQSHLFVVRTAPKPTAFHRRPR